MTTRIALYGGTNLTSKDIRFVRCLTRSLLAIQGVVLISGGFKCYREHPTWISIDRAVLFEAKQLLDQPEIFNQRFETWLPLEKLDRPDDRVERFAEGTVHRIPGTDQARRFNLVKAADGLVTIKGEGNHIPHRIDIDDYAGNIPSLFLSSLERARSVVVDVTGLNPNVMYELGQVHARGINPFLIYRRKESTMDVDALPFYLRHEKMANEQNDDAGQRRIADALTRYLRAVAEDAGKQQRRP